MSTAEILSMVSVGCYIAAGVFALVAVFLWFRFRIPSVINDLSGRAARKSIAKMRSANERSGAKSYRPSESNAQRGKLTDTMHPKAEQKPTAHPVHHSPIPDNPNQMPETGLLGANRAEVMAAQQTEVLSAGHVTDENETVPLQGTQPPPPRRTGGKVLTMLEDIMFVHTDEAIG